MHAENVKAHTRAPTPYNSKSSSSSSGPGDYDRPSNGRYIWPFVMDGCMHLQNCRQIIQRATWRHRTVRVSRPKPPSYLISILRLILDGIVLEVFGPLVRPLEPHRSGRHFRYRHVGRGCRQRYKYHQSHLLLNYPPLLLVLFILILFLPVIRRSICIEPSINCEPLLLWSVSWCTDIVCEWVSVVLLPACLPSRSLVQKLPLAFMQIRIEIPKAEEEDENGGSVSGK